MARSSRYSRNESPEVCPECGYLIESVERSRKSRRKSRARSTSNKHTKVGSSGRRRHRQTQRKKKTVGRSRRRSTSSSSSRNYSTRRRSTTNNSNGRRRNRSQPPRPKRRQEKKIRSSHGKRVTWRTSSKTKESSQIKISLPYRSSMSGSRSSQSRQRNSKGKYVSRSRGQNVSPTRSRPPTLVVSPEKVQQTNQTDISTDLVAISKVSVERFINNVKEHYPNEIGKQTKSKSRSRSRSSNSKGNKSTTKSQHCGTLSNVNSPTNGSPRTSATAAGTVPTSLKTPVMDHSPTLTDQSPTVTKTSAICSAGQSGSSSGGSIKKPMENISLNSNSGNISPTSSPISN